MPETLTAPLADMDSDLPPEARFMQRFDNDLMDQVVNIDRGGGREAWQLFDATNVKNPDGTRTPQVTLRQGENNLTVPVTEFLGWQAAAEEPTVAEYIDDEFGHVSFHTTRAKELAELRGQLTHDASKELFADREIIDRNTSDPEGKVDIRSWVGGGEAIVVDSLKDPEPYRDLMAACEKRIQEKGALSERDFMKVIYETVVASMKYDLDYVKQIESTLTSEHRKINLANYLADGKGVCRHMALATQWLGARVAAKYPQIFEGGAFTTPVNKRTSNNSAHEWARYTSPRGTVYILDPAQKFVGTLEEVLTDTGNGEKHWEYFADADEKRHYEQNLMGDIATKNTTRRFFRR